jgi:hypothetical protein
MKTSSNVPTAYDMLTVKQRRYVELRLEGKQPKEAASAAGFSAGRAMNHAYNALERHPAIKAILREAGRSALRKLCLTREHVLHGLLDAVDTAASSTELTNAWKEIGRVIGAYEPEKVQIDVNHIVPETLRTMPIQELAALADLQGIFDGEFIVRDEEALDDPEEGGSFSGGSDHYAGDDPGDESSAEPASDWRGRIPLPARESVQDGAADGG